MRAFSCFFKDTSRATRDTVNTFFYIYHALMLRQLYEGLIDWIWRISDTVITSQKEFFFWAVKENGSGSPPIINRPISSHFKTDERLIAINKSEGQKHATSKYNLFLFPKSNSFSSLLGTHCPRQRQGAIGMVPELSKMPQPWHHGSLCYNIHHHGSITREINGALIWTHLQEIFGRTTEI